MEGEQQAASLRDTNLAGSKFRATTSPRLTLRFKLEIPNLKVGTAYTLSFNTVGTTVSGSLLEQRQLHLHCCMEGSPIPIFGLLHLPLMEKKYSEYRAMAERAGITFLFDVMYTCQEKWYCVTHV